MLNNYYQNPAKPFPVIDFGEFILREKHEDDAEAFLEYYNDPEVNKFILCEIPQTAEEAKREIAYWRGIFYRNEGAYFAIARKDNNRLIGTIGISGYNSYQSRIELSYDLARPYWRHGVISLAAQEVIKYAFDEWKVNRIEAFTAVENMPSVNLLIKLGFTKEGRLRQHRYHRGRYVDVFSFSKLRQDFDKEINY